MSGTTRVMATSTYGTTTATELQGAVCFNLLEGPVGPDQWQVQIELFNANPQKAGVVPVATKTLSLQPGVPVSVSLSGGGVTFGPHAYVGMKGLGLLVEGPLVTPSLTTVLNGCVGVYGENPDCHLSNRFQMIPGTAKPCDLHFGIEWQSDPAEYIATWRMHDTYGQLPLNNSGAGYGVLSWADGDFRAAGTITKTPGSWSFTGEFVCPNQANLQFQSACFAGWVGGQ